nr:MAG TPA: hypothetical protein [Caudoviricetes sp.]
MLKESILKTILGTGRNVVKIEKALNGGFAIQSIDTLESGMCQYQTWETTQIDLYVDQDGNITDGDYGIEEISQPSCDELESSRQWEFNSNVFNNRLEKNYNNCKDKSELIKVVSGLISLLKMMDPHDVVKFEYSYYDDVIKDFEYKPFIKKAV